MENTSVLYRIILKSVATLAAVASVGCTKAFQVSESLLKPALSSVPGDAIPDDPNLPSNQPPVQQPPVQQPPIQEPPVQQPPVQEPPVQEPPKQEPPVQQPPAEPAGRKVEVSNADALRSAIGSAAPGDVITLLPGVYRFNSKISVSRSGSASNPIYLRAATLGTAILEANTPELFYLSAAYWIFENLEIRGVCGNDSDCEHALHVVGGANRTIVRSNKIYDFNAHIKGNGSDSNNPAAYPSDVLIEGNDLYANRPRNTGNPVTWIDIVGGERWVIRSNVIRDFAKAGGNGVSYGAFLKGNGKQGVFERNLVMCERKVNSSGTKIGLSFGGGGTGTPYCLFQNCETEPSDGVMRNNIIMNCSDVGIYLIKSARTTITHNTMYNTNGIDSRFATSSATITNNIMGGGIHNRDGGASSAANNLQAGSLADYSNWFQNPSGGDFRVKNGASILGKVNVSTPSDLCGAARSGAGDLGAIQYTAGAACATSILQLYQGL